MERRQGEGKIKFRGAELVVKEEVKSKKKKKQFWLSKQSTLSRVGKGS